jgi:hypothetical protein
VRKTISSAGCVEAEIQIDHDDNCGNEVKERVKNESPDEKNVRIFEARMEKVNE